MHPLLSIFLKLTLGLAAAIALFMVLTFIFGALFKIVLIAALAAAVILGGFYIYSLVTRRSQLPLSR